MKARTFKRDRYTSAFDHEMPGVMTASYDVETALLLLHRLARTRGLLGEEIAARDGSTYTLGQLIEIANQALLHGIDPALWVYRRLQQNAEAAHTLADGCPDDSDWEAMNFALSRTLSDKPIAGRGEVSRARRNISRRIALRQRKPVAGRATEEIPEGGAA